MIKTMIKKILLIAFACITSSTYGSIDYDFGLRNDDQLNGTSWSGIEYGLYGQSGNGTDYNKKLLLFDVQLDFIEDEFIWHDDEYGEWPIDYVTICLAKLSKTTDKKALKVWAKMSKRHEVEMRQLEESFSNNVMHFDVTSGSNLQIAGVYLKYRVENDCLAIDLKRENDTIIGLYSDGKLVKTIQFCQDFAHRSTQLRHGEEIKHATWTYWFEGNTICFCYGDKNTILKCPFQMSSDGKIISLLLKKKGMPQTKN